MARSKYVYDRAVADAAVDFFPRFLTLVEGEWAGKPFHLQDWQAHHVRQIFGWRHRKNGTRRYRFVRGWVPRKNGKGLALDTPLPTPSGWTTMGQVAVGDVLYDENGRECRVTRVGDVRLLDCYEIKFSNGECIVCDGDHLWLTRARIDKTGVGVGGAKRKSAKGETLTRRVRNTREIFATQRCGRRGDRNHSLDMPAPLAGRPASLLLDPYVLGYWLGDGTSDQPALTIDPGDVAEVAESLRVAGLPFWVAERAGKSARTVYLTDRRPKGRGGDTVVARLRQLGVLGQKHIPAVYLRASLEQRLALLQGLMDSDGYVSADGGVVELVTTLPALGNDIAELLASFGIKFSRRILPMRCNGRAVPGEAHRFQFCVSGEHVPVFRLRRKRARLRRGDLGRSRTVQIISVAPAPSVPTKCIEVDSPSHLFRCGRSMLPTHNSAWFAGLGHLMTVGDGEAGAQVYSHALDKNQASILFDMAARMAMLSPALANLYEATKTGLFCTALMAGFRPLSGEAFGKHGLSPHCAIGDEAHAWKDGNLHTFLVQGMGARRQPLDMTISTAGEIHTYGHELYQASKAIFLDPSLDEQTYSFIYEADPADDWTDPKVWAKANPNLGVSLKREFLEAECKRAQQTPRLENDFKRYHLNIWVEQAVRWLPMKAWPANTERPDDKDYWKKLPELMKGRPCYDGIDLGSTRDLSAKVSVFPPDTPDGRYVLVPRFWMPEAHVANRDKPEHPYGRWVADGFEFEGERRAAIETTPGNVQDYDFIIEAVMRDAARYKLQKLGIDVLFQAMQVAVKLMEFGIPVEMMRQGHLTLGAPTLELERLFEAGRLEHGNHPVLEWMFRNAVVVKDHNGNIKPDKKRASEKIDGVVATVEALGLIHVAVEPKVVSIFDRDELWTERKPDVAVQQP